MDEKFPIRRKNEMIQLMMSVTFSLGVNKMQTFYINVSQCKLDKLTYRRLYEFTTNGVTILAKENPLYQKKI